MLLIITAVKNTAGNNYVETIGEHAAAFPNGAHAQIRNSIGNDGIYKVTSAVNIAGMTRLTFQQPLPSSAIGGQLNAGVYQIDFSDVGVPGKAPIVLAPATQDSTSLSIMLPARGTWNYGEKLVENAVHVLENFAGVLPPSNPTVGQHWFDYESRSMKTYTDSKWTASVHVEDGILTFKDPQNATMKSRIVVTASEPVGKTATGLTIYPEHVVPVSSPILRVLNASGDVNLAVLHNDAIKTNLRFVAASTATSEVHGKLSIGLPTNAYSTASVINVKGNVDLSGHIIMDETAASVGIIGRTSGSSLHTVDGRWTMRSVASDALLLSNGTQQIARFGETIELFTPTKVSSTLNVTDTLNVIGDSTLTTTTVTGTITATDMIATSSITAPTLNVTNSFEVNSTGSKLLKTLDVNNQVVSNVLEPLVDGQAANKKYVDDNDFLKLMADVNLVTPANQQALVFQTSTSKWINSTLTSDYISGFDGSAKDSAGDMIISGTHLGITPTYDSGTKTVDLTLNPQTIDVVGSVLGSIDIDWNGTSSVTTTLSNTGVASGTYTKVTVGLDGRVILGGTVTPADIAAGDYDLQGLHKVKGAVDPVDPGDYVTLRYLETVLGDIQTILQQLNGTTP